MNNTHYSTSLAFRIKNSRFKASQAFWCQRKGHIKFGQIWVKPGFITFTFWIFNLLHIFHNTVVLRFNRIIFMVVTNCLVRDFEQNLSARHQFNDVIISFFQMDIILTIFSGVNEPWIINFDVRLRLMFKLKENICFLYQISLRADWKMLCNSVYFFSNSLLIQT
jgi:hypothetical protein